MHRTMKQHLLTAMPGLALGIALLAGCGNDATPDEYMELARQAYGDGQTELAGKNLKRVLELDPDNGAARELLARVYIDEGKGSAAEIALDKAQELGVQAADMPELRLKALLLQDKAEEAISAADEALARTDDARRKGTLTALRGVAEQSLGKEDEARASFSAALELAPDSAVALVGLAQLALATGDTKEGRTLAERATSADPGFAPGWSLLGDILQFDGDLARAEEAYTEAINKRSVNGDDLLGRAIVRLARNNETGATADVATLKKRGFGMPHAAFGQGLIHLVKGEAAKAADQFQAVTGKHPNFIKAVCYSGVSQAALGNANRAAAELERCLKKYPDADALRRALAAVLVELKQPESAERQLQPLVNRNPPDTAAVELLADIKLAQADSTVAVELLQKLVKGDAGSARDYLNLGRALAATGNAAGAEEAFEQAAALDPEIKRTDLIAALSLLRTNRTEEAVAKLEESVKARPDDVQTLNLMAVALLQAGNAARAASMLEQALATKPDYTVASLNLALLRAKSGDDDAALVLLDEVLKREPTNIRALGIATTIDAEEGQVARGRSRIDAAATAGGASGDLLLVRARLEKQAGNLDGAIELYRQILVEQQEPATAVRELAEVMLLVGRTDEALKLLNGLTKRSEHQPRDWLLLARVHDQLHDAKSARRAVDEALREAPNFPAARLGDIRLLMREGNIGTARANLEALKKDAPTQDIAELHELEGLVLLAEKRPQDAIASLRRALEIEPSGNRVVALARGIAATGDREGTLKTLQDWMAQHPDDTNVGFVLADTYAKTGAIDKAEATYRAILAAKPGNALAMNNLAELLLARDKAEALNLAKQAAELLPDSPGILDTHGMALYANGDLEAAVTTLRKAYDLSKGNSAIGLHLATVLVRMGSPEEARRLLRGVEDAQLAPAQQKERLALAQELGQE